MINHFTQINNLLNSYSYFAVFFVMFLAQLNISLPIPMPSELTLLYTGYKIYMHKFILTYAVFVGISGDFLGAILLFIIVYKLGHLNIVKKLISKIFGSRLAKYENALNKHSFIAIVIGRTLPYSRNYITLLSGLLKFQPKKFTFLSFFPSTIRAVIFILLGIRLGPNLFNIVNMLSKDSFIIVTSIVGIICLAVIIHFITKFKIITNILNRN